MSANSIPQNIPALSSPLATSSSSSSSSSSSLDSADAVDHAATNSSQPPLTSTSITDSIKISHPLRLPILILATVAFIFSLQMAKAFFIPLIFSVLLAYTLNPIVATLERWKISRLISTSIVLLSLLFGAGLATNSLINEFNAIVVRLPEAARQLTKQIAKTQDELPSTMQQIQAVATEFETATNPVSSPASRSSTTAPINKASKAIELNPSKRPVEQKNQKNTDQNQASRFQVRDWVVAGSFGVAGFVGQMTMIFFLLFFLLSSGDRYKRKLVKITGPSLSSKKITVLILDAINKSLQKYMFMLFVTTVMLVVLMWIGLRCLGVENAGAWAVAAGCLHIIPYVGTILFTAALAASTLVQFGSISQTLIVVAVSLGITILVGTLITTWMTGRLAKMNPLAIFIGLLFWGWLWGIWGLLLGVPIVVMIRVVAEHVDGLQSVAELLSE
jgi:predicted PurR-regulated permease PerM